MPAPRPSGSGGRKRASKSRREHEGVTCRAIKRAHQSDNLTMPVVRQINNIPRKVLSYKTPQEVFTEQLFQVLQIGKHTASEA